MKSTTHRINNESNIPTTKPSEHTTLMKLAGVIIAIVIAVVFWKTFFGIAHTESASESTTNVPENTTAMIDTETPTTSDGVEIYSKSFIYDEYWQEKADGKRYFIVFSRDTSLPNESGSYDENPAELLSFTYKLKDDMSGEIIDDGALNDKIYLHQKASRFGYCGWFILTDDLFDELILGYINEDKYPMLSLTVYASERFDGNDWEHQEFSNERIQATYVDDIGNTYDYYVYDDVEQYIDIETGKKYDSNAIFDRGAGRIVSSERIVYDDEHYYVLLSDVTDVDWPNCVSCRCPRLYKDNESWWEQPKWCKYVN